MNDLIEYLLNYAFDCGIGYKLVHADPYDPSLSLKNHNLMVINLNWHNQSELPFIIGHEIGHFILGDKGSYIIVVLLVRTLKKNQLISIP